MDKGELIRFRVENEKFTDQTPVNPTASAPPSPPPIAKDGGADGKKTEEVQVQPAMEVHKDPPYQINASCRDAGLGLVSWW